MRVEQEDTAFGAKAIGAIGGADLPPTTPAGILRKLAVVVDAMDVGSPNLDDDGNPCGRAWRSARAAVDRLEAEEMAEAFRALMSEMQEAFDAHDRLITAYHNAVGVAETAPADLDAAVAAAHGELKRALTASAEHYDRLDEADIAPATDPESGRLWSEVTAAAGRLVASPAGSPSGLLTKLLAYRAEETGRGNEWDGALLTSIVADAERLAGMPTVTATN